MADPSELVQALRPVVDEFHRLGVRYYVGGSIASSMHRRPQYTRRRCVAATRTN